MNTVEFRHFQPLRHWKKVQDNGTNQWLQLDSNPQPLSSKTNTQPFSQTGLMIELLWVLICTVYLTVYSYHVTCTFQSESTLHSCLNVKSGLKIRPWNKSGLKILAERSSSLLQFPQNYSNDNIRNVSLPQMKISGN